MRRNKFLTFALATILIGSASFISCVSDTESESVQNIRNSRAELMRAEAALATAQAEVARTLATAEAALMAAQARQADAEVALIAAQAKQVEAEAALIVAQARQVEAEILLLEARAAYENAQTEIAKERAAAELARLEIENRQAEVELARLQIANEQAEIELARLKMQADRDRVLTEQAIQNAEIAMEQARLHAEVRMRELQNQLDKMNINCEVLQAALIQYQALIAQVNCLTSQIASLNLSLMRAEALKADNLASNELMAARVIAQHNRSIETSERSIAQAEIRIENWNRLLESAGANVLEEIAELNRRRDALRIGVYNDAVRNLNAAFAVADEAAQAVQDFRNMGTVRFITSGSLCDCWNWWLPRVQYLTKNEILVRITNNQRTLDNAIASLAVLQERFEEAVEELPAVHAARLAATDARIAAQAARNEAWEARNAAQDAYNNDPTPANAAALNIAVLAYAVAHDALIEAQNEENDAWTAYWAVRDLVDNLPSNINWAEQNIRWATQNLENNQAILEVFENDPNRGATLEAAFIAARQVWQDARDAHNEVRDEINALQTMINDIRFLWYSYGWWATTISVETIANRILNEEDDIRQWTENIAVFNKWINEATLDVDVARVQLANDIARMKADIALLESGLAAMQAQAAAARAVMNERMP